MTNKLEEMERDVLQKLEVRIKSLPDDLRAELLRRLGASGVDVERMRLLEEIYITLQLSPARDFAAFDASTNFKLGELMDTMATRKHIAQPAGWISVNERMPEPSDDIYYEVMRDGDDHSFAYYDPAGAKKEKLQPEWCWFDREENGWCHKNRYTHWKLVTAPPQEEDNG